MTQSTPSSAVTVHRQDSAEVVTIRRPGVRNALGPEQALDLAVLIEQAGTDPDVLGLILTGEGAFCAGGDLPALMEATEGATPDQVTDLVYTNFQRMVRALRSCTVPTVAAIDGAAIGLGLDLALWCDARFVGPKAKLGQGWAAVGLVPGIGGARLLNHFAPGRLAHLLDGHVLRQDESVALGLAERADDALEASAELVRSWQRIGRPALEGYAQLSRDHLPDDSYLTHCAQLQGTLLTSEGFRARARAILGRD